MELSIKQTLALDILEDFGIDVSELLFGGAAGGGKSAIGCYWQLKNRLRYPGTRSVIGRASLKTLRETTLNTFFKVARLQNAQSTFKYIAPSLIRFNNGSEIYLKDLFYYPSDPECDELGSLEIMDAFIDEANQVVLKVKNVLKSRIREFPNDYAKPKLFMSCNPAKNWTKTEFYTPSVLKKLEKHRYFIQALLKDNPFISQHYEESLKQLDKNSRARLLDGDWNFMSDPNQLASSEDIMAIFTNFSVPATGKRYISADIARLGSARTIVRVWDGWRVLERVELVKYRVNQTADKIRELAAKYAIPMSRVICDEDGVGGGVVDLLNCKGFVANSSPTSGNYGNIKDQCGFYVAKLIKERSIYEKATAETQDFLTQELEQLQEKTFEMDGKRRLKSKQDIIEVIGRSPDDSDTYLMRAWFDVSQVTGPKIITGLPEVDKTGRTNFNA